MPTVRVRDLERERDEIESELEDLTTAVEEAKEAIDDAEGEPDDDLLDELDAAVDALEKFDTDRLKDLNDVLLYADRDSALIPIEEFPEYVRDMIKDQGIEIPSWVAVDWEQTAENVGSDYTVVDFEGEGWYVI